jgi:hypothetical protein
MRHEHACVSIAVVASLCSLVSVKGSQPLADVPFDLVQQHLIVVKGSVGPVHGLNLLIDTGTIPSVVDQRIAGKLRLHMAPSQLVAFGQTVRINSASLASTSSRGRAFASITRRAHSHSARQIASGV